jgi:mycofactocin precursor
MSNSPSEANPAAGGGTLERAASTDTADLLVEDELLVEEISIDGMCGVY